MPPFSPHWDLHPSVGIGVALLAGLYLYGVGPVRRRAGAPPLEWWRPACYFGALAVILVSLNGPIHDLSDTYLFSVHMAQHLLLTMVMPPLLIAGLPGWLVERVVGRQDGRTARSQGGPSGPGGQEVGRSGGRLVWRTARFATHPVVAGILFSAILIFWHTVGAYDLMMRDHEVHVLTHLTFMAAAVLLWWPVMSPAPSLPRLTPGLGMLYLFLVQIPMQLLGAILTFAGRPLYTWYTAAPRTWGLSVVDDQKLGGLLMWIPGNLWIWGAISILFFQWARNER